MGKERRRSTVSDAAWTKVIQRFRAMIEQRDPDARRRAQHASRLLKSEAAAIYAAADELERERRNDPNPIKYQAVRVARRVIKAGHLDGDSVATYIRDWAGNRGATAGTPRALRAHGHDIWRFGDSLGNMATELLDGARRVRRGEGDGGALPSIAMDYLIEHTTQWGDTLRKIAQRLIAHRMMPPPPRSDDPDPDPVSRWMTILRTGRSRAKKRRANGVTEPRCVTSVLLPERNDATEPRRVTSVLLPP